MAAVRNNWIDLKIKDRSLVTQAIQGKNDPKKGWQFYEYRDKQREYPGKLSKSEWTKMRDLFISLANQNQLIVLPEAELLVNKEKFWIVWLNFKDLEGNLYKIDVLLWKTDFYGNSNGDRKIDTKQCPLAATIRNKILDNSLMPKDIEILEDILNSRPDKIVTETLGKLQYKLNSLLPEDGLVIAAKSKGIEISEDLDPYNQYIYKGSPGDLADFDITIDGVKIRVDVKLIETMDTSKVETSAHDAQYLICWCWRNKEPLVKQTSKPCMIDLLQNKTFQDLMEEYKAVMLGLLKEYPFLRLQNLNRDTCEITYTTFGN